MTISIIIPTYNEVANIGRLVGDLRRFGAERVMQIERPDDGPTGESYVLGHQNLIYHDAFRLMADIIFGKAIAGLALPQTSVEEAIREAFDWFRQNNYVS